LKLAYSGGGRLPATPHIPDLLRLAGLEEYEQITPDVFTDPATASRLLSARFELGEGVLSAESDYEGMFEVKIDDRPTVRQSYSTVLKLELGTVKEFAIVHGRLDGTGAEVRVQLEPPGDEDELDVWIRYDCDTNSPPNPNRNVQPEAPDVDFAMNYALSEKLVASSNPVRPDFFPRPQVERSWREGSPIGLDPDQCMRGGI
jgi:hypothetical protein